MRFQNIIWITDNALSFVTKSAIIKIIKVKYTAIILNLIAVNFVNDLGNYTNIRNKSFVFHELLSTVKTAQRPDISFELFIKIFYKCELCSDHWL